MSVYLSTAYLAPIEYYSILLNGKSVFIEKYENYIKQSYRNRCTILTANGPLALTIPVESNAGKKCPIQDIRIAEHGNWRHLHWNAIVSAYRSTPFFEYYEDYFKPFYENKYDFLFDFNEELRVMILDLLDIDDNASYTDEFSLNLSGDSLDLRDNLSPKKDLKVYDPYFEPIPYYQVFEERYDFVENLSIIDLLFNMGNESIIVLSKSIKKAF